MNPLTIGSWVFVCLFGAGLLALFLRAALPQHHLSAETKDTVRLTMGLVATLTALVLGLLIASAKGSYDTEKSEVTIMAAKLAFLDRLLAMYGPESAPARTALHQAVERIVARMWPTAVAQSAQLDPQVASAEGVYRAIQDLSPQNDTQRALKTQALGSAYELGQMRWLLFEQGGTSISTPLLVVVVCWLAVLFFSFGLFAPANGTSFAALIVAALSVAGAIFLILELDQPFDGLIQISSRPMLNALSHLGQ